MKHLIPLKLWIVCCRKCTSNQSSYSSSQDIRKHWISLKACSQAGPWTNSEKLTESLVHRDSDKPFHNSFVLLSSPALVTGNIDDLGVGGRIVCDTRVILQRIHHPPPLPAFPGHIKRVRNNFCCAKSLRFVLFSLS